jgi:hypothetical protein
MTKYIVRLETDRIRWFKIKKAYRELITLQGRLYSNEDRYYVKDRHSSDAIMIKPIDSNQVAKPVAVFVDPNMIRAKIMSKEISGSKKKAWLNFDASKIWMYLIGAIIVGVVGYTILTGGLKV